MRRVMGSFTRSVFALAIAMALGFGGYQGFATAGARYCEFDPPVMGPCQDHPECQEMCDVYYGKDLYDGVCSNNCCVCILL